MSRGAKVDVYPACKHKREEVDYSISEDVANGIASNFKIIPTYAKGKFDYLLTRHYSLERNELLKCRWAEYKRTVESRAFAPFQFPDVRDLHFHNCAIRFLPGESIHRCTDHKKKLKAGPGVDFAGPRPIPHELIMKRTKFKRNTKIKCYF